MTAIQARKRTRTIALFKLVDSDPIYELRLNSYLGWLLWLWSALMLIAAVSRRVTRCSRGQIVSWPGCHPS
jgi:hypothetical protein